MPTASASRRLAAPPDLEARLHAAGIDQLDAWLQRAVTADPGADVFGP